MQIEKEKEKNLLDIIKIVPIFVLITFSITTTYFMINYHDEQIKQEIKNLKKDFIYLQKDIIKKEVEKVYRMIRYEYTYFNKINSDEINIKNHILTKIESMRYDKNGYIFIIDYTGNFLANVEKSFLEKNQIELKDKTGFMVTKEIIKVAQQGKGYLSYIGLDGTHHTQSKKISFVKGFENWEWAIGYGFHPSDIEPKILKRKLMLEKLNKDVVKKILLINLILTSLFIVFFMVFSRTIQKRFSMYKKELKKIEHKNRTKDEIIFHQSKMATIGELLNIISHQWRQPLAQINSLTMDMYIEQKNGKLGEKELKENIIDIEKTTSYLSHTIDDFSRFFIQEKEKSDFLPKTAIKECINILSPSLKHIDLKIDIAKDIQVNGYITLYQQVILTILTNSLDVFSARNISNPKISINIDEKNNKSYISVLDNAKGIDDKIIENIFDLYFSTKTEKKVTGLGLYIAKQIIQKNMNGKIMVKNYKDGVKFTIEV